MFRTIRLTAFAALFMAPLLFPSTPSLEAAQVNQIQVSPVDEDEALDLLETDEEDSLERASSPSAATAVTYNDIVSVLDPSKELSIVYGSKMDYTLLTTWTRNSYTNQQFYFVSTGDGYSQIKARHSNLCLQPAASKLGNGVPVVQTTCSSSVTSQRWKLTPVGSASLLQNKLTSGSSTFCMEILNGSKADGAPIGMNYCASSYAPQQFYVTAAQ